jgi:hypothetical protein
MYTVSTREIVVARYNENIDWLSELPVSWQIIVYNKGAANISQHILDLPNITVIPLENVGREAGTYIYHMMTQYNSLADITIFTQANPFDHAPEMIAAIKALTIRDTFSPNEAYIPLTICYNDVVPAPHIRQNRENRFFHVAHIRSDNLEVIEYDEVGCVHMKNKWCEEYNAPQITNIMSTMFDAMQMPHLHKDTIPFHYAACFAVLKPTIMQYAQSSYATMFPCTHYRSRDPEIFERTWLHMFNQSFEPDKVLSEYSLKHAQ